MCLMHAKATWKLNVLWKSLFTRLGSCFSCMNVQKAFALQESRLNEDLEKEMKVFRLT